MSDVKATIFRYDPSVDAEPYYAEYSVPWHENMSVLELLRYVHDNIEPVSFDYNCRAGSCGLCGMKVNGNPVLACIAPVEDGSEITIEPLDRFPVVRDLIIDRSVVKDRIMETDPQFQRSTPMVNPRAMDPTSYLRTGVLQQCRECMLCMSVCPAIDQFGFNNYAGPLIMTKLASRYFDDREDQQDKRLMTAVREGLFNCLECGTCTAVCPKGSMMHVDGYDYSSIDHVSYFKMMKEDARAKGWEPVEEELVRPVSADDLVLQQESGITGAK